MWPGNTADAKSLLPVVERMRAKFRVREVCVGADRGCVSAATLEAFEAMEPPVHYVVGVRMRRTKEVAGVVLRDRSPWREVVPERTRFKDPAPLKVKQVESGGRRYVVCLNEEEKRKDAHDRQAILSTKSLIAFITLIYRHFSLLRHCSTAVYRFIAFFAKRGAKGRRLDF